MTTKRLIALCAGALLLLAAWPVVAQEESKNIELTVYNQGLGLVKDVRTLDLEQGIQRVRFTDVASQIDPTSVRLVSLEDPTAVSILEQNFQFDLVDRARLLEKYLGKEITLVTYDQDGREVRREKGTLLSIEGGEVGVVRVGDQIVLNPGGVVELPKLPEGLIVQPTLVWDLSAQAKGKTPCEVSYMTQGISWQADYVLVVNADDTGGDLNGWVTLTNSSGASYPDAKLKLIAGDVATAPEPTMEKMAYMARDGGGAPGGFAEKAFFEYYIYSLDRRTTVADRETKQILFRSAPQITLKKRFVFEPTMAWRYGGQDPQKKVAVKLEIENSEKQGLGIALPMGRVRVFKADADASLQFVGEDRIDHTPRDETLKLYIGNAFDLVGEETQMDHKQIGDRVSQDTYSAKLRNRKETDTVQITYITHPGGEWEVLRSSDAFTKKDANTAECTVTVEPGQEKEITYTIQSKW
jgi:hypothetical protein